MTSYKHLLKYEIVHEASVGMLKIQRSAIYTIGDRISGRYVPSILPGGKLLMFVYLLK